MIKALRTYYSFVFNYKKRFAVFLLVLVLANVSKGVQPYFYKLFIDAIPSGNYSLLLQILAVYIVVRFSRLIFETLQYYVGDHVLLPIARDIRLAVFKQVQDLDFAYHLNKSTGSLISAFKRGDNAVFNMFHSINNDLFSNVIQFFVMLFFFAQIDMVFFGAVIALVALIILVSRFLIQVNMSTLRAYNAIDDKISGIIVDNLINFETVKLFAKEVYERKRLAKKFVIWMKKLWAFALSFRLMDIVIGVIGNGGIALILWMGLLRLSNNQISGGDFIMIIGFLVEFYYRLFELFFKLRDIAKNNVDLEKYFSALDENTTVKDPEKPLLLPRVKGEVHIDNVYFSYGDKGETALSGISLRIRQGQSVAFVGHSGAGKTTIVKLLLRFFDPAKGSVQLDGVDIRSFTKSYLRSHIGVVPQDPILFNNSIAYNISYGSDAFSQKELVAATKMAQLYDFIQTLPDGFETQVGERGLKLSGGQKQRLAIARMVLSNPEIIVFDEATSQLDSESEQKIQDAFWQVSKDKTTIVIAHRLSTVVKADKIVVMDGGKIVEQGSHRELLTKKGQYARFWDLQTLG